MQGQARLNRPLPHLTVAFVSNGIRLHELNSDGPHWNSDSHTGFQQARSELWATGLGVCSLTKPCGNPSHQVDNAGQREYVLFRFSAPVDPISVRIDPFGTYDRDVSYWTGNIALPLVS